MGLFSNKNNDKLKLQDLQPGVLYDGYDSEGNKTTRKFMIRTDGYLGKGYNYSRETGELRDYSGCGYFPTDALFKPSPESVKAHLFPGEKAKPRKRTDEKPGMKRHAALMAEGVVYAVNDYSGITGQFVRLVKGAIMECDAAGKATVKPEKLDLNYPLTVIHLVKYKAA
jgi:hypothetical protein